MLNRREKENKKKVKAWNRDRSLTRRPIIYTSNDASNYWCQVEITGMVITHVYCPTVPYKRSPPFTLAI